MRYEIDLDNVTTKMQFHEKIRATIPCPDYYGGNLDALYDVLTEISGPVEIVFLNFREFTHQLPGFGEVVEHLCADAQAENPELLIVLE